MQALFDEVFWDAAGLHVESTPTLFKTVTMNRIVCLEPTMMQQGLMCLKPLFTRLNLLLRVSRTCNVKAMAFVAHHIHQIEQGFVTLKLKIDNERYLGLYPTGCFDLIAITKEKIFTPTVVDMLHELTSAEADVHAILGSASFRNAVMKTRSQKQCRVHKQCCYCELHNMNLLRPDWSTYELRFQESLVTAMLELGCPVEDIVKISQTERMFNEYDRIAKRFMLI